MLSKLRILIADDESIQVMSLKAQLEEMGHQVVAEASTGAEAVKLAGKVRPDLAILDIKMPEVDGIEAAKTISAETPIPIILLTAYSDKELVERAAEAGIFTYLVKPIGQEELLPAITLAFSRFNELQCLKREVEETKEALKTRKLVEQAKGILMKRLNLGEAEAFKCMQKRSQEENKKLAEIAQVIITAEKIF